MGFGAEIATILRLQMVARLVWAMQAKHAICEFAELVSLGAVRLTVAGLSSARAQKLVAAGLIVELAAVLHLRTAARIARATR